MREYKSIIQIIIGIVFALIFFACLGGIIYFQESNKNMSLFLFGVIFFKFSYVIIPAIKEDAKNLIFILVPIVGLIIMSFSSIAMWGHKINISLTDKVIVTAGILVFILGGVSFILKTVFGSSKIHSYTPLIVGISIVISGSIAMYLVHFR